MGSPPVAPDAPDADLVRRAQAGERRAFAEIYRRYHTVVYRFARMMSGSVTIAEDVTQEVFVALMRDLHRYRAQRAGLSTYLYGMARNLTRSRLRRERRFVRLEVVQQSGTPSANDPCAVLMEREEHRLLRRIIAELPVRYREVVILCALHELSYADAAAVLGTPVGTVRSRLNRGRRAIARRLGEVRVRRTREVPNRAAGCVV